MTLAPTGMPSKSQQIVRSGTGGMQGYVVNVSVNPSVRCGAPDTEPGPSGVDNGVDEELMRSSLHTT